MDSKNLLISLKKNDFDRRISLIQELFPKEFEYLKNKIIRTHPNCLYKLYNVSVDKGVVHRKDFLGFFNQPEDIITAINNLEYEWLFIKVFNYGLDSGIRETILLNKEEGDWNLVKKEVF